MTRLAFALVGLAGFFAGAAATWWLVDRLLGGNGPTIRIDTVALAITIVFGVLFLGLAIGAFLGAIGWGFHAMCGCP